LAKLRRLSLKVSASKKGVFMLRFSQAIVVSLLASTFLLACGDKINPMGSNTTGGGGGSPGVDTGTSTEVTYSGTIKPFLDTYCTSCHQPSKSITPPLDTYNDAKANATACKNAMQISSMPPSGKAPSDAEKQTFQDWITLGFPQ
jgi:hypothetical protein